MKTYSTLFQSALQPGRFAMSTVIADSPDEAMQKMANSLLLLYGNLGWQASLTNVVDLTGQMPLPQTTPTILEVKPIDYDKNWLMKLIIDSRDKILFGAVKKHLTKAEVAYLTDKLV